MCHTSKDKDKDLIENNKDTIENIGVSFIYPWFCSILSVFS